jgi:hypothetical protein
VGGFFYEAAFHGLREFFMEGELDFPALFKKDQKLNK